jgi:tetratricopeptide (TPR) repeat protein
MKDSGSAGPAQPRSAGQLFELGTAHAQQGRYAQAVDALRESLVLDPANPRAHNNLGAALQGVAQLAGAVASYDRAVALDPGYAEAWVNRGLALRGLGRVGEALASFERALGLEPGHAGWWNHRGRALRALGRPQEALESFERASALEPDAARFWNNRGNALQDLGRLEEALASYDRAVALSPDYAEAHGNRAQALRYLMRLDEALAGCDRALALDPRYAEAGWNKSLILLLLGRYREGWELHEQRLRTEEAKGRYPAFPGKLDWRGREDLGGKRLLVHSEQGLGDAIQFCRYLPGLSRSVGELIVQVPRPLVPLVASLDCALTVVAKGSALPAFDAACPMMSLPLVFGTTLETIPARIPYLHADPAKVVQWQARLGERSRPRVGLAWSGATIHRKDRDRSVPLDRLDGLVALPGIEWHSLQKEVRPGDLDALNRSGIRQHQQDLGDFSDTAALVACLDLVIGVDTSVVHLSGALGKPVWVLLPHAPDFRWLLERTDSPWYPTARLYRQPGFGDWGSVVGVVADDLSGYPR